MAKQRKTQSIITEHTQKTSGWNEPEKHESYGTVTVSRCTGHVNLFDVSSPQQHFISLKIHEAERYRSLSNDRTYQRKQLIEVWMSETQFARMLSSISIGGGVPCTLHWVGGDDNPNREPPPMDDKGAKLKEDLKVHTDYVSDLLNEMDRKLTALTETKHIGKGKIKEVQELMGQARMTINDNLPFILTQATEQLEGAISEAHANIDAYQKHKAMELGLGVVKDKIAELNKAAELEESDDG